MQSVELLHGMRIARQCFALDAHAIAAVDITTTYLASAVHPLDAGTAQRWLHGWVEALLREREGVALRKGDVTTFVLATLDDCEGLPDQVATKLAPFVVRVAEQLRGAGAT